MIIQSRRNFIIGLTSALAAPAIVRAESLMKVRAPRMMTLDDYWNMIGKSPAYLPYQCEFIDILYSGLLCRPEWSVVA